MDRRDNKADGVLNGPTTEAWFDHWYRHLRSLGVRFVHGAAARLEPAALTRTSRLTSGHACKSRSPTVHG